MTDSTDFDRRKMLLLGAASAAAAGLAPAAFAQGSGTVRPSRLRHYVIAAKDMDAVCGELYKLLDVLPVSKEAGNEPTLAFGFRTKMIRSARR